MVGLQTDNQSTVVISIELGPVHGDHDLGAFSHHIRDPIIEEIPDVELGIGEQAVHLFHGIFAFEAAGQGEAIADGMDSQRPGLDNPKGGIGERKNTLGMHV